MPPRKKSAAVSAAAGEVQGSSLKLIIEKGPLAGTTREFKPGVRVNIGRLVRGNTFAVKDAGISSKHLIIQADAPSDSDDRRWTVTDLDSSNGTILNDVQLGPSEPAVLSDGDVIKIGEQTSIRIEMVENEAVAEVRRNERRRARGKVADLVIIDEDAELWLPEKGDEEKIEVEAKQGRNVSTRRTRNSKKIVDLTKDLNVEEDIDLGKSEIKGSRGVTTRRTRSSARQGNVEEIEVDLSVIEGKKTTRGGRGRKKLFAETISEETEKEEPNPQHEMNEEEEEKERSEIGDVDEPVKYSVTEETEKEEQNPQHEMNEEEEEKDRSEIGDVDEPVKNSVTEEGVTAGASSSAGVQEHNVDDVHVKRVVDLEKMTLGEWLDFLMEYEPQQIIAETEEMLTEMRRKAERCHEFMLEHKKAQGS